MPRPLTGRPGLAGELARLTTVAVLATGILLGYAVYRISAQGDRDERRAVDAIVVLGAAQYNGRPGAVLEARLSHALALYEAGLARYVVVTGGNRPGDRTTEAATSRAWLLARDVPPEAILFEDRGRTTLESIEAVGRIFREEGLREGLFVSDRTHMLRVLRMATDQGIAAWGSPTRTSPSDRDAARWTRSVVHELAGLAVYYLGAAPLLREDPPPGNDPRGDLAGDPAGE